MKLRSLTHSLLSLSAILIFAGSAAMAQTPVPQGPVAPPPGGQNAAPTSPTPPTTPAPPAPSQMQLAHMPPPPPPGGEPQFVPPQPVPDAYINTKGIEANMPAKLVVSGVAAVVNGQPITYQQLVTKFISAGAPQFLDEMINEQLIRGEAKKEGVVVTPADVNAKLLEAKKFLLQQYPGETWAQFLSLQGRSESYIRDNIYDGLLAVKLIEKTATAASLAGKVHFYHILKLTEQVPGGQTPETDAVAQQQIADIRALIVSGKATFQEEAKKESQDSTASKGGDLGWIGHDAHLDPAFAKAAFALKEGEISQPVKSQFGWHLILAEKFGEHASPAEVQAYNAGPDADARARQQIQSYLAGLRKSAVIVNNVLQKPAAPKITPSAPFVPHMMPKIVPQPITKPGAQ